jgi:hypothetical protein
VINRVVSEGLIEKGTFEQRSEGDEEENHIAYLEEGCRQRKNLPGRFQRQQAI